MNIESEVINRIDLAVSRVTYGEPVIVDDADLVIEPGDFFDLIANADAPMVDDEEMLSMGGESGFDRECNAYALRIDGRWWKWEVIKRKES